MFKIIHHFMWATIESIFLASTGEIQKETVLPVLACFCFIKKKTIYIKTLDSIRQVSACMYKKNEKILSGGTSNQVLGEC